MTTLSTVTDIEIVQGATFHMQVTWKDASTNPATPISLSGYRAHMQIRLKAGTTGTPLINLASDGSSPALTLEPASATGVVQVRISAALTRTLTKNCVYDLFIVKTADATDAIRLVHGSVTLSKSVTVDP